jgi:hypothetical protein
VGHLSLIPTTCVVCGFALLLCGSASSQSAQVAIPDKPDCFDIHVRLNGKPVDGPKMVTYKTNRDEQTVNLQEGCFRVPSTFLSGKTIDVFFTLPGNRVYLSSIPTGFYSGSWDVDLEDKRFGSDVALPKHARTKEVCAVTFHVGEPERISVIAPCRSPFPPEVPKNGQN